MEQQFDITLRIMAREPGNLELESLLAQCRAICQDMEKDAGGSWVLPEYFSSDDDETDFFVFAQSRQKVVGAMANTVFRYKSTDRPSLHIQATVVRPELQKRGISAEMFKYLEQHLKGFDRVTSMIDHGNSISQLSRFAMGFETDAYQNSEIIRTLFKVVDPKKTVKTWHEARPATATIYRKGKHLKPTIPQHDKLAEF